MPTLERVGTFKLLATLICVSALKDCGHGCFLSFFKKKRKKTNKIQVSSQFIEMPGKRRQRRERALAVISGFALF